ncbi:MAG: hypothetical protein JWR21_2206 [Herminiimonas sp.]|nr:hypothetical protein [Herminiimonas sp.]
MQPSDRTQRLPQHFAPACTSYFTHAGHLVKFKKLINSLLPCLAKSGRPDRIAKPLPRRESLRPDCLDYRSCRLVSWQPDSTTSHGTCAAAPLGFAVMQIARFRAIYFHLELFTLGNTQTGVPCELESVFEIAKRKSTCTLPLSCLIVFARCPLHWSPLPCSLPAVEGTEAVQRHR